MTSTTPFYWGTATAAFQIEGSPLSDGAVSSDWHLLSRMPGMIFGGDDAEIACDHYRRWEEDISLMRELGVNAYRFSIAWPRVFNAPHRMNPAGFAFYDRLVDGLLEAGITPFVTIFHWEMPEWLDKQGGWLSPDAPKHYLEYASFLFDRLGDRVRHWITLNEPFVYYHSYVSGFHWPFAKQDYRGLVTCCHHELTAHQHAVDLYKSEYGHGEIGLALSYNLARAASESESDRLAARRADGVRNRWFLDRIFRGHYPEDILTLYGRHLPEACHEAVAMTPARQPDFMGLNYYAPESIKHDDSVELFRFSSPTPVEELQPMLSYEAEGIREMVNRVHDEYAPAKIYITENGMMEYESEYAVRDFLDDEHRVTFLRQHLAQVERCRDEGLPLHGYFHWSLMDNFEWRWGANRRFGLIHVARKNQERRLKKSALFLRGYLEDKVRQTCKRYSSS